MRTRLVVSVGLVSGLLVVAGAQITGQVAAVSQSLTRVVPNGGTPLYRTMVDSAASVGPGDSATTSAAVIITDGEDTSSGLTPQSTAAQLPAGTRLNSPRPGDDRGFRGWWGREVGRVHPGRLPRNCVANRRIYPRPF